jgi:hypothetical protein
MDLEATRGRLRLGSALIMLAFVVCHLCAHAFLLISFDAAQLPATVYIDNIRLAAGKEAAETQSRMQPHDTVSIIDNRWVSVRQVARPEDVPESAEVTGLRKQAEREAGLLRTTIQAAQTQGIDTIYAERHLVTAELGLGVRPLLAWYNNDAKKREMYAYVAESCRGGRHELEDLCAASACARKWTILRWGNRRSARFRP